MRKSLLLIICVVFAMLSIAGCNSGADETALIAVAWAPPLTILFALVGRGLGDSVGDVFDHVVDLYTPLL